MAKKTVKDSVTFYGSSTSNCNQNYEFSNIRTWLQNYANNFSSSNSALYNHLVTMNVVYNFNTTQPNNQGYYYNSFNDSNRTTTGSNKHTLSDKIKLLSCTELGYTDINYLPYNEGSIYSNKFSSKSSDSANSEMIRKSGANNTTAIWWTRTRSSNQGGVVCAVYTGGQLGSPLSFDSNSIIPAIRISVN